MPSSVVVHMDYYPDSATLRITFTSGKKYDYLQVPAKVYEAMRKAASKGSYLNRFIKGHFPFKEVTKGW